MLVFYSEEGEIKNWLRDMKKGKHIRLREILLDNIPDAVRERRWKRKQQRLLRGHRGVALFRKMVEKYVEKEKITGRLKDLMLQLGDKSVEVRSSAALNLGGFRNKRVKMLLTDRVMKDPSGGVKWSAAIALRNIREKKKKWL